MPLCCCCLSLQVVSYHACVCGLFILTSYIHCVSVPSKPSECCVCAVLYAYLFIFSLLLCFFCMSPAPYRPLLWQTAASTAKILSRKMNLLCRCADKHACGRRSKRLARQALLKPKECSAKGRSFQGSRSLGSVEPSGSRDSTPGNMPR